MPPGLWIFVFISRVRGICVLSATVRHANSRGVWEAVRSAKWCSLIYGIVSVEGLVFELEHWLCCALLLVGGLSKTLRSGPLSYRYHDYYYVSCCGQCVDGM